MKQFTVVFPVHRDQSGKTFILLGKQSEGRPLAGYLNGYGGKVKENESIEDAAKREVLEELGVTLKTFIQIGTVTVGEKEIIFFLTEVEYREYMDSEEMIDNTWYELYDNSFIGKMLPGDDVLIKHVRNTVPKFFNNETIEFFIINKDGDEIKEATKALDASLKLQK